MKRVPSDVLFAARFLCLTDKHSCTTGCPLWANDGVDCIANNERITKKAQRIVSEYRSQRKAQV